jgi:hypothetical protein
MDSSQFQTADLEYLTVNQRIAVIPVQPWAMIDFGSGEVIQLYGANYVVFIAVRLKDVFDFQTVPPGQVDVNLAVAPGVDYSSIAA